MARRKHPLSEDDQVKAEKRKQMKQILRNYHTWKALYEDRGLSSLQIGDEEWHIMDVLDGIDKLPTRQRQSVWYVCVEGYPQGEVARMMGFTKWSTPVQQYVALGLDKLVKFHEEKNRQHREKEQNDEA